MVLYIFKVKVTVWMMEIKVCLTVIYVRHVVFSPFVIH